MNPRTTDCWACDSGRHEQCTARTVDGRWCRCCGAPDGSMHAAWEDFGDRVEELRAATVDRWMDFVDRHFEATFRVAVVGVFLLAVLAAWTLWP